MASCFKCGKAKIRRDKFGRRKCRRCGCGPSSKHLDMGGNAPPVPDPHSAVSEQLGKQQ